MNYLAKQNRSDHLPRSSQTSFSIKLLDRRLFRLMSHLQSEIIMFF